MIAGLKKCLFEISKALLFVLGAGGIIVCVFLLLSTQRPKGFGELFLYFACFAVLSIAVLVSFGKYKAIRVHLWVLVMIIDFFATCILALFALAVYADSDALIVYDPQMYLSENSSFEQAAATVMPPKDDFDVEQVVFYEHQKKRKDNADGETLWISVAYVDEAFLGESERMNQMCEEQGANNCESFYLDGALYKAFSFYVNGNYYEFAYHICSDTKVISYIVKKDDLDSFLSITDGFAGSYGARVTSNF